MTRVYAEAAPRYLAAGWRGVLPLPARRKKYPPSGYTGRAGALPDETQVADWVRERPAGNVALRLYRGVAGVDVDQYDDKRGADELARLEAELGPLPPTWSSSARPWPSGIRLYRIPVDVELAGAPLPGVEVVQFHHRYVVAPPSIHTDTGEPYRWRTPEGEEGDGPPRPEELPALPDAWVARWRSDAEVAQSRPPVPPRPAPADVARSAAVQRVLDGRRPWTAGGRHDEALRLSMALARLEHSGHPGATEALEDLGAEFIGAKPEAGIAHGIPPTTEWDDLLASARARAATTHAKRPDYAEAVAAGRAKRRAELEAALAGWLGGARIGGRHV